MLKFDISFLKANPIILSVKPKSLWMKTDDIIKSTERVETSFESLTDTTSHIEALKADKDIFPFITNLTAVILKIMRSNYQRIIHCF